jgi:hypothetical protein
MVNSQRKGGNPQTDLVKTNGKLSQFTHGPGRSGSARIKEEMVSNKLKFRIYEAPDPSAGLNAFGGIVTIEDNYPNDEYVTNENAPLWINALAEIYDVNKDWIKRIK